MKIIYIGAFRLPNLDAAAARVLNNAKALRALGCEVKFISWSGQYRDTDICEDHKYRCDGFEYVITNEMDACGSFLHKLRQKFVRGDISMKLLKLSKSNIDLIIAYNADFFFTRRLLRYTNKHNIKFINDITEWFAPNELHIPDQLFNMLNMYYVQKQVKNKIVISSFLNNFYTHSHNIIIPPLCDASDKKWTDISESIAEKYRFNGIQLIYAGTSGRKDKLHTVINVIQHIINEGATIRLLILGTTKKSYINQYHNLLEYEYAELSDDIVFLGRVAQELVPAYYKISDFMILLRQPSVKSNAGFPTKFAESIMSETPIITNITSDLDLYLKNGYNGVIVEDDSAESLYKTLKSKIITLSRQQIDTMKTNTINTKMAFDYHSIRQNLSIFIDELQ